MIKVITKINPVQTGKVTAITYAFFSLIIVFTAIISKFFPSIVSIPNKPPFFSVILMAIAYPIFGFVGGVIIAAVYNLAAGWVGGIEIELEDKWSDQNQ